MRASLSRIVALLCALTAACAPDGARQPGVRNAHAMMFDERDGQVVMFGGADESQVRGDTWAWDARRRVWRLRASEGPSPRTFPAFAYDAARQQGLLFGGNRVLFGRGHEGDATLGDTWIWKDGRWTERGVTGPRARSEAALAYDRSRERVVLFGGYYRDGSSTVRLGDTWEWDGTSWARVASTGPEPRSGAGMAYDDRRGVVVLFGGSGRPPGTWQWNGRTWSTIDGAEAPSVFNAVMAFDSAGRGLLRFGGWTGSARIAETWLFLANGWVQGDASGPAPRNHSALVLDRARSRALLFGGHDGQSVFGDAWEWDGRTWTQVLDIAPRGRLDNGH